MNIIINLQTHTQCLSNFTRRDWVLKTLFNLIFSIIGELQSFVTNVTPPSTVRQYGTPPGKGLTIQKRYRAPSDMTGTDSSLSTPRLKPRKQQSTANQSMDTLSVSGVAMRPTKQHAGIRRF
jgi:hypothetical protein